MRALRALRALRGRTCCDFLFCAFSVKSVQQLDAGQYWCEVEYQDRTFSSERAWITVEGGTLNAPQRVSPPVAGSSPGLCLSQAFLTSPKSLRTWRFSPTPPSTSPVLLLDLQNQWRCCGCWEESRRERRNRPALSSTSQVSQVNQFGVFLSVSCWEVNLRPTYEFTSHRVLP